MPRRHVEAPERVEPAVAWQAPAAAGVFAATFLLLALGRVGRRDLPRGAVALAGGLLTWAVLRVSWRVVDLQVLLLLAGLMALAGLADASGLFAPLQTHIARLPPRAVLPAACGAVAVASAVLLNDAAVVVLVPVLLPTLAARGVDRVAATVWMAVSSNVGSLLTPFGNPQNAVLARAAGLGVGDFLVQQGAVFAAAMAVVLWRASRVHAEGAAEPVPRARPRGAVVVALAVAGFLAAAVLWPERLGTAAAVAALAAFLLAWPVLGREAGRSVRRSVDGNVLALFVGLYLLTAGLGAWFPAERVGPERLDGPWSAAGVVLALSNAVGNVPAVLALERLDPAWVAAHAPFLVSVSTLGGSVLLTGSAATLLAVEAARRQGTTVSFARFARTAAPWMVPLVAVAAWWMW